MSTFNNDNTRSGDGFHGAIADDVKRLRLNHAFKSLESNINSLRATEELRELNRMRETYGLMVRYLATGAPDPSRADMTATLQRDILAMADRLDFARLVADSPGSYYSTARVLSHRGRPLAQLIADYDKAWLMYSAISGSGSYEPDISRQYEETLQELFRAVMATPPGRLSDADVEMLVSRASDPDMDFSLRSQITSALLVGLLEHYDRNRLVALLSIYEQSDEERIQAQALTGIVLGLRYHSDRPRYDRDLALRLQALADDLTLYPRLRDIFYTLLQTQDTKRAINYFQTKIMPQMQKINPEELKKMMEGASAGDWMDNPEWIEKIENSELGKKLRKLNDMQFEGADMMVMAFANLKSFPFFGSPGNWLLPFDSTHSVVRNSIDGGMDTVMEFLESADMMCDSDKYSFVLAIAAMPSAQREMMTSSLSANFAVIKEQMQASASNETKFRKETVRYLRNLYRLFTLSSKLFGEKRGTAADPVAMLEQGFDFMSLPYLGDLLAQQDVLEIAAEFQFSRKNFALAAPLLEELLKSDEADSARLWEKLGYIRETEGNLNGAIDCYRKAEILNPESSWLLRHLGQTLEKAGRHEEAAGFYERLLNDDDPDTYARYGVALLRLGRNEEARKIFRKLNYDASENQSIAFDRSLYPVGSLSLSALDLTAFWLALAEMNLGDYEKATSHLPLSLPDAFLPYSVLASFLQGNYALAVDGLSALADPTKAETAAALITQYTPDTLDPIPPEERLNNFFRHHIDQAGASPTDFYLLLDSVSDPL